MNNQIPGTAPLSDNNHNVTAITDVFGNVKERFIYDPYGTPTVLTSAWNSTSDSYAWAILFQGKRFDTTTQTYDFDHRIYKPSLGTFIQADPLGYPDGANRYQMEEGNITTFVDPTGLSPLINSHSPLAPSAGFFDPENKRIMDGLVARLQRIENEVREALWQRKQFALLLRDEGCPGAGQDAKVISVEEESADWVAWLAGTQATIESVRALSAGESIFVKSWPVTSEMGPARQVFGGIGLKLGLIALGLDLKDMLDADSKDDKVISLASFALDSMALVFTGAGIGGMAAWAIKTGVNQHFEERAKDYDATLCLEAAARIEKLFDQANSRLKELRRQADEIEQEMSEVNDDDYWTFFYHTHGTRMDWLNRF